MSYIYKILRDSEWQSLQETGFFAGSPVDQQDGFVHLSYADQVQQTASKHFAHSKGLILAQFDTVDFGETLKAEVSRGGQLFPHLYATLPRSALCGHWMLSLGADGAPIIPLLPEA